MLTFRVNRAYKSYLIDNRSVQLTSDLRDLIDFVRAYADRKEVALYDVSTYGFTRMEQPAYWFEWHPDLLCIETSKWPHCRSVAQVLATDGLKHTTWQDQCVSVLAYALAKGRSFSDARAASSKSFVCETLMAYRVQQIGTAKLLKHCF